MEENYKIEMLSRYCNDPHDIEHLKKQIKEEWERLMEKMVLAKTLDKHLVKKNC